MADNSVVPAQHVTEYDSHEMPAVSSFSTDIPVRMSYSDYFRTMPRSEKHRYSSTVGASFQGRLTGPRPGMSATEMVIFQSEQMAEMDRIISELRQENKRLRSELGLTIRSLNQTSFALRETEAQLESANQMNENLQRKFVELTGTFRESETEIQAMLHQLRRYIQTELEVGTNAPHSRNGYRPNGMQPVDGSRSGLMGTEDNGPLRLLSPRDGRGAGVPGPVPGTEVLPEPRQ